MKMTSGIRAGLVASASLIGLLAAPAFAQTAAQAEDTGIEEIVVTAQRSAQSLQDVPIAVSAFSAEALQKQQINNALDLQLSLPNITFTKGNFSGASFTIRGIGDLCVGGTCDAATAIHSNDLPLFATRIFETEYFDLERVEVLRGPQGTLFGRNASSGVVNFITARPQLDAIHAAGEVEYGNYNSVRVKGMFNLPVTDNLGVRVAGFYLKRDGFTENLFNNTRIDGRDMYALRGSVRWQPGEDTTIDAMAYYFKEDDNRTRIQKQLCQRDPTGVLGCLPARRDNAVANQNSGFYSLLTSREFFAISAAPFGPEFASAFSALGLGSLYGPDTAANSVNPADPRQVNTPFTPTYETDEFQAQLRIQHDFGPVNFRLSGQYQANGVESQQDYLVNTISGASYTPGLTALAAYAAGAAGPVFAQLAPMAAALIPTGPTGNYCTSLPEETGTGAFGGNKICSSVPLSFDRSAQRIKGYTVEGLLTSEFDGAFNFLVGAIYNQVDAKNVDYYVNAFGTDYVNGALGFLTTVGQQATNPQFPNSYLATPFFRSNQSDYRLESYGIFGEAYYNLTDTVKITAGLRYNNDKKTVAARTTLASWLTPYGSTNAYTSPFIGAFDADPFRAGNQDFARNQVSFSEFTGRAVIDWKITEDNLIYASYSRGYKSGGVNPPLSPVFATPQAFAPEFINSFEVGSKNTFLDGTLRLNLTGFYYQYKGLQLSRIVNRTSINDNVDANIYGIEMDAIIQPVRALAVNLGASWLKTEVASDLFLSNPRDPSGGRSDAVIIKDISNAANCAVVPTGPGGAALTNGYVAAVNAQLGLQAPVAFPTDSGINGATGAFSLCSVLDATAAANGVQVLPVGVTSNIRGKELPQAPNFKASVGIQYTAVVGDMSVVPRVDVVHTGTSFGNIFNGAINRIPSYTVVNAQVQVNGKDDKWYLRGFVQNLTNNNAITGLYLTDQSTSLFTNIFTLEPRRYGVAAGFRF